MALRANHYDAAFEGFLREQRWPYVAVNEARRPWQGQRSLKSLDFVVCPPGQGQLLIDVKGRRCPQSAEDRARLWENWATNDDLASMTEWQAAFGTDSRALLVFAYWLDESRPSDQLPVMCRFRQRSYSFFGVWADDYRTHMHLRSPKWDTVWLSSRWFRDARFPLDSLLVNAERSPPPDADSITHAHIFSTVSRPTPTIAPPYSA